MTRSRVVLSTGLAAGLAANYWVLESLIAAPSNPTSSWISDLGARSESTGWIFDLLDFSSGVLLLAFAISIRPLLARTRALRWGVAAMIAMGTCSVIDGAIPLSCAESLTNSCELRYDALDLIHGTETFISIFITVGAFGFLALGFFDETDPRLRRLGVITAIAGLTWILFNILIGAQYLLDDLDQVKGIFHRGAQVVLGVWLIAMAIELRGLPRPELGRGTKPSPGLGRIGSDG
jgi:hypothetical protein